MTVIHRVTAIYRAIIYSFNWFQDKFSLVINVMCRNLFSHSAHEVFAGKTRLTFQQRYKGEQVSHLHFGFDVLLAQV